MIKRFALVICLLAAGCQVTPLSRESGPQDLSGKGLAILSVTQSKENRASTVFYFKDSEHPNVLRQLTPYVGELIGKRDFIDPPGALWAMELSPGVHQIEGWSVLYNTGLGEGTFQPRDCPPISFQIRAGQIVYLGNLHMNTFMVRNFFGLKVLGRGYPVFRDEHERDLSKFHEKYPRFAQRPVETRLLDFSQWRVFKETENSR